MSNHAMDDMAPDIMLQGEHVNIWDRLDQLAAWARDLFRISRHSGRHKSRDKNRSVAWNRWYKLAAILTALFASAAIILTAIVWIVGGRNQGVLEAIKAVALSAWFLFPVMVIARKRTHVAQHHRHSATGARIRAIVRYKRE